MPSPLIRAQALGQSLWYDDLSRTLIESGELARLIEQDGLRGVTSNPAIFEKALASGDAYDAQLEAAASQPQADAQSLYEELAIKDIRGAADALRRVYDASGGGDGFVSLEVSPHLARDSEGTIDEARRLHRAVDRPNLMIKVPATPEGLPAIEALVADGISVNATLLFAVEAFLGVAEAYQRGLEKLADRGGDLSRVASVASFFVSRIDSRIDSELQQRISEAKDPSQQAQLRALLGRVAIANARLAYARQQELLRATRWQQLSTRGARVQRLLWASTSTKNPDYPKTLYVDALIAPETVNTLPAATWEQFRSSENRPVAWTERAEQAVGEAGETMRALAALGISMQDATDGLLEDGVRLFADAFDALLAATERKRRLVLGSRLAGCDERLGALAEEVSRAREDWRNHGGQRRLWSGDTTLWTGGDEDRWLGWLRVLDDPSATLQDLEAVAERIDPTRFDTILLLGMGGSSLCPELLAQSFGTREGSPALAVLDSTVPDQIRRQADRIDPKRTLFVVSSKSGGTLESNLLMHHFLAETEQAVGPEAAPGHFVAITDPGSELESFARERGFRAVAFGDPRIGGRFSALSNFGLLPARLMGIDVSDFIARAQCMRRACGPSVPPAENPGVALGIALGSLARLGRDKLTLFCSPSIAALGGWLEQLIAESTGKGGLGILPVVDEVLADPTRYGDDRVFVFLCAEDERSTEHDSAADALAAAGHPVIRIDGASPETLGQEFFRWEIATAVAGAVLGVHPFDQPDVEAAKRAARGHIDQLEAGEPVTEPDILGHEAGLSLFGDDGLKADSVDTILRAHLDRLRPGDYFAIQAFVERSEENQAPLEQLRHRVRDAKQVATTLGFGPRFLHSTGQLHKGGPDRGLFLQITACARKDLPIAGRQTSFGGLARAQAQGDFEVLVERGRRILRVHLETDLPSGLVNLSERVCKLLEAL